MSMGVKILLYGGLLTLSLTGGLRPAFAEAPVMAPLQSVLDQGGRVSALAVRLRDLAPLMSLNPDERLIPASLTKLVVAAAALERWSADHTFATRIFTRGQRSGAVLEGDLVVAGGGDPMLINEKLWFLCTDVARLGIRDVRGDLVLNTALFAPFAPPDADRVAAADASEHAFDGALSAVAVNYSTLAVVVGPGTAAGEAAAVGLEPYPLEQVTVVNRVRTTAGGAARVAVARRREGTQDILTVSGQVPVAGPPLRIYRSVSAAEAYSGAVFRAFLAGAGVTVRGGLRVEREPLPATAVPLAVVAGQPLDGQIRSLLRYSNNFIADMLTVQMDLDGNKTHGATLQGGLAWLSAWLQPVLRNGPGQAEATAGAPVLASGSGLTPANRLSARDVVAVLVHRYRDAGTFPVWLAALPTANDDGTLQGRFTAPAARHLRGRIRAKTATLTEPQAAVGLAGYGQLADGEWMAFAILVNGTPSLHAGAGRLRDAIDDTLVRLVPAE